MSNCVAPSDSANCPPRLHGPACPQESVSKTADTNAWTYLPGKYPKLDLAIEQHAAAHGTIWSPHLLGPDFTCFGDFIRTPELIGLCPIGSDARYLLEELQRLDCFSGSRDEGKRALTAWIKQSALYKRGGSYRYVQRILNSIWQNYDGLLAAKKANLKALDGAAASAMRADERRTRDAARKTAARSADPIVISRTLAGRAQTLRDKAAALRKQADRKEAKARRWLDEVKALNASAERREAQAGQIEAVKASIAAAPPKGGNDAAV